jgi:hypothetical protein
MTAQFFIVLLLASYAPFASATELCPPTNLNVEWSAKCFERKDDSRQVRRDFIKNLRVNRFGVTTILIVEPRELVAVDRSGRVVIPGIRHTGDFDYPNAHLGIGRFYSSKKNRDEKRTHCGYFKAGRFQIIVPARFDHCEAFKDSYALACTNCVSYCTEPDCQNSVLVGGQGTMVGSDGKTRKTFALPTLDTVCTRRDRVRISELGTGAAMLSCLNGPDDPFNEP